MTMLLADSQQRPVSGVGIGLRAPHFDQLMQQPVAINWLELLADNHLAAGGLSLRQAELAAQHYPLSLHCVGMNLGGVDALDFNYLERLRTLMQITGSNWLSDHLCFSRFQQRFYHDLLPLPYSEEALQHVAARIRQVQDYLGIRIMVENVSAYLAAPAPMSEAEFLTALVKQADCELLLDINNLYVNQVNLGANAEQALAQLPMQQVREMHLAGYEDKGSYLIDAHNNRVSQPVWQLFAQAIKKAPHAAVLIEWDNDLPELQVLLDEARLADEIMQSQQEQAA